MSRIRQNLMLKIPEDNEEGLMVNEQEEILEGLTSNFGALIDNVIYTAPESKVSAVNSPTFRY